jgi:hypothetical protein
LPVAAQLVAAIFACGLLALSCNRQPVGRDAVEVANTGANTRAREAFNGNAVEATPPPAETVASPTPDSPIRKIDFENFSYPFPDEPKGRKRIRLRDGEQPPTQFSKHGIPHDIGYGLTDVSYGDLTGDGIEEAIVILALIHSGTGITSYIYIYTLRPGRPALLWSFATGDRADGGFQKVAAENGELVVELRGRNKVIGTDLYADDGTNKGDCCPDAFTRTRYRWRDGRFRLQRTPEVVFLDQPQPHP